MTVLTTKEALNTLNTDNVLGASHYIPTWKEYSILMKLLMVDTSVQRVVVYGIDSKAAFMRNACTEKTVRVLTRPNAMLLTEEREIVYPLMGAEDIKFARVHSETSFTMNGSVESSMVLEETIPQVTFDRVIMIQTKSTCNFSYRSIPNAPTQLDEITDTLHVFIPEDRRTKSSTLVQSDNIQN